MSTGRDDDALSWGGDDDPTLDPGTEAAPSSPPPAGKQPRDSSRPSDGSQQPRGSHRLPRGFTAVGRGSTAEQPPAAAFAAEPTALGNAGLVGVGMIAAAFILYSVGWLIVSVRLQSVGAIPVPSVSLITITLAAAAAPLIWFAAAYSLTRRSRTWVRFTWLIAGVVLLVPWPFLVTGAFG
ncbi:DNA polymerase III subunit gamma/tau [Microbacterium lushaniae]|uniref:DNA polymerase III subunit gamma/tau n=1 Tax=Microbacterium lushaniae TaxID=2614639 RepID=A0A5J6L4I5_9MICO|nr:DNA polymerase III subunit gamma/tau [Microbacterium lushaniae]QEW03444.1 DNA polymerase III subunit gamma/tau [Microbacterium lushaniae]